MSGSKNIMLTYNVNLRVVQFAKEHRMLDLRCAVAPAVVERAGRNARRA